MITIGILMPTSFGAIQLSSKNTHTNRGKANSVKK